MTHTTLDTPVDRPAPPPDSADAEASLDPADWEEVRQLGHRMIDDMLGHLQSVRDRPVWQPIPAEVRARFDVPAPAHGIGASATYDEFVRSVLPYGLGNLHPRFWGWVIGSGTFTGALAEFLSAAMNTNAAGFNTSLVMLEERVLEWFGEVFGMMGSSGILTSGASEANLIGMTVGLRAKLGARYHELGVHGLERRPIVYASEETHFSVRRAVRLLGLGDASFRVIASNASFEIDVDALCGAISADISAGHQPCMVVANAGTVGVGAFDDMNALADIAAANDMWLHVDAAFGGMLALVPARPHSVRGMERADSLTFDLHKWLHVPIEAGCVLVRDADAHRAAFAAGGAYTTDMGEGPAVGVNRFAGLGPQQSRSARAVKVWFSLCEHGFDRLGQAVEMNIQQAAWLAHQIEQNADLQLLAPVACNMICFRCVPASLTSEDLDEFNKQVLRRIQVRGIALPTAYTVRGSYAIRCSITNHRTTRADLGLFLQAVTDIAREVLTDKETVSP